MNSYPGYTNFFKDVAARLELLGQQQDKINLFFVADPNLAETLLSAIRTKLTLPCLLVEFYDEDLADRSGKFTEIAGAFVVLQQAEKKNLGHDHVQKIIYEEAKPAADQIFALMERMSLTGELKVDGKAVTVFPDAKGMWVGPLHNDLYGWRYEFTWRIAAATCFNPAHWKH